MTRRLRAAVLLAAMLCASVAPSLAVCVTDAPAAGMACCTKARHCDGPALKRACCPCSPQTPATASGDGAILHPPAALVAGGPWQSWPTPPPAALASAAAIYACSAHHATHDPPWLLHGALLI